MENRKSKAIVRKWAAGPWLGEYEILFPTEPADRAGLECMSYSFRDGHGGADYYGMMRETAPVPLSEAESVVARYERTLPGEFTGQHRAAMRASYKDHRERMKQARARREPVAA